MTVQLRATNGRRTAVAVLACILIMTPRVESGAQRLGDVVDAGLEFRLPHQQLFAASRLTAFDPVSGRGTLQWDRYALQPSLNFNKVDLGFSRAASTEFPGTEYDRDPALPFDISFVSPRALRLRFSTRNLPPAVMQGAPPLMLAGPLRTDSSWHVQAGDSAVTYSSAYGKVRVVRDPWAVELYDAHGKLLTRTQRLGEPRSFTSFVPFSFVRRARDLGRSTAATF